MKVDSKLIEEQGIIIRYYRTEKHGSVTVCCKVLRGISEDTFEMGVAFCSPIEKQFDKQKGKLIATGRLMNHRRRGYAWTTFDEDTSIGDLIFRLLGTMQDYPDRERISRGNLKSARWFGAFIEEISRLRTERKRMEAQKLSQ